MREGYQRVGDDVVQLAKHPLAEHRVRDDGHGPEELHGDAIHALGDALALPLHERAAREG